MALQVRPSAALRHTRGPCGLRRSRSARAQGAVIPWWTGTSSGVEYTGPGPVGVGSLGMEVMGPLSDARQVRCTYVVL